jgi:hypothetical protein
MERETGFEPATFSLGIHTSFANKEHMRPWRQSRPPGTIEKSENRP